MQCPIVVPRGVLSKSARQVSYKNRSLLSHSTPSPIPQGTWQSLDYTKKWKTETAFSTQVPSSVALFFWDSFRRKRAFTMLEKSA